METVVISEHPSITIRLGNPSILHWEDESGYLELDIGMLSMEDSVIKDLNDFWSGRWTNWAYGEHNARYSVTLEMERIENVVTLRLDYHHMLDHIGIDRTVVVSRSSKTH